MTIQEKPAKGVTDYLLYNPFEKQYFFRVYDSADKSKYTDYDLKIEDMEIQITDRFCSLIESEDGNCINYNRKVLGKK